MAKNGLPRIVAPVPNDPKPWLCQNCFDRFAKKQNPEKHVTNFKPRSGYDQNVDSYDS